MFKTKNDWLIQRLIDDTQFVLTRDGVVKRKGKRVGRPDREGYIHIYYKGKRLPLHRIIYAAFNGPLDDELVVHHKDHDHTNNNASNLELTTQRMNIIYATRRKERLNDKKTSKRKAS